MLRQRTILIGDRLSGLQDREPLLLEQLTKREWRIEKTHASVELVAAGQATVSSKVKVFLLCGNLGRKSWAELEGLLIPGGKRELSGQRKTEKTLD